MEEQLEEISKKEHVSKSEIIKKLSLLTCTM
ncbi:MAG: hypothetical protein JXA95_12120 [Spirochaetales bacterium]|nr:hypothetical protein [Spirochaetales bacterium]